MTKTLNQIIIFFLHQNQNIVFSNIGNQNIFFRKNSYPPWKLNGPSLINHVSAGRHTTERARLIVHQHIYHIDANYLLFIILFVRHLKSRNKTERTIILQNKIKTKGK